MKRHNKPIQNIGFEYPDERFSFYTVYFFRKGTTVEHTRPHILGREPSLHRLLRALNTSKKMRLGAACYNGMFYTRKA